MSGLITALAGMTEIGDRVTITLTKCGAGRFRAVVVNKLAEPAGNLDDTKQMLRQGLAFPIVVEDALEILEEKLPAFLQKVCEDRLVLKDSFAAANDSHREALATSMAAAKASPKTAAKGPSKPQVPSAPNAPEKQATASQDSEDDGLFGDSLI